MSTIHQIRTPLIPLQYSSDQKPILLGHLKLIEDHLNTFRGVLRLTPIEEEAYEEARNIFRSWQQKLQWIEENQKAISLYSDCPDEEVQKRVQDLSNKLKGLHKVFSEKIASVSFLSNFIEAYDTSFQNLQRTETTLDSFMGAVQNSLSGCFQWKVTKETVDNTLNICDNSIDLASITCQTLIIARQSDRSQSLEAQAALFQEFIAKELKRVETKKNEFLKAKALIIYFTEFQRQSQKTRKTKFSLLTLLKEFVKTTAATYKEHGRTFQLEPIIHDEDGEDTRYLPPACTDFRGMVSLFDAHAKAFGKDMQRFVDQHSHNPSSSIPVCFVEVATMQHARELAALEKTRSKLYKLLEHRELIEFVQQKLLPLLTVFLNVSSDQDTLLKGILACLQTMRKKIIRSKDRFNTFVCELLVQEAEKVCANLKKKIKEITSPDVIEQEKNALFSQLEKNISLLFDLFARKKLASDTFFAHYRTQIQALFRDFEEEFAPYQFAREKLWPVFQTQDPKAILLKLEEGAKLECSKRALVDLCHSFILAKISDWKSDLRFLYLTKGIQNAQGFPGYISNFAVLFQELVKQNILTDETANAYRLQYESALIDGVKTLSSIQNTKPQEKKDSPPQKTA